MQRSVMALQLQKEGVIFQKRSPKLSLIKQSISRTKKLRDLMSRNDNHTESDFPSLT